VILAEETPEREAADSLEESQPRSRRIPFLPAVPKAQRGSFYLCVFNFRWPTITIRGWLVDVRAFMGVNFRLLCNDGRLGAHREGEMCINWVKFLKSKRKFRLRSVMLCELPTIAGLEQT